MVTSVLNVFLRAVFANLRWARDYGIERAQCGAVTFVQRFGSALNCTIHFHTLVLDGVYAPKERGSPEFFPLKMPETSDVQKVVETVRVRRRSLQPARNPDSIPPGFEPPPPMRRLRVP